MILSLSDDPETLPTNRDAADAARAARGDTLAFGRLYQAHSTRIFSLARRMMGDDHAAEATQEVFVRAWQKLGSFRAEAAFGTWLHRLAINLILTRLASLKTERGRLQGGDELMEMLPARATSVDLSMDFDHAIGRLPRGARQIFVLHDVEGYRHEEIASMLGITSGTSKAQLHRARMMLRQHLDR